MKLCRDCQYFSGTNYCHAPQNGVNPVDGKPMVRFASTNRTEAISNNYPHCGTDGEFWKQKLEIKKPWYKFWI